jgi:hypothetical protein
MRTGDRRVEPGRGAAVAGGPFPRPAPPNPACQSSRHRALPEPRPFARRAPMGAGFAVPTIHGVPVFTRNLLPLQPHPAGSLPPVPCARLSWAPTTTKASPRPNDRRGRCPAASRQHRHRYAADLPMASCSALCSRSASPASTISVGVRCNLARIRQVRGRSSTYGTSTLVPRVHLLVVLAGPGPSGSAGPSRRCRGCSHPPWRLPGRAAPSFTSLLRQASGGVLALHSVKRNLVAHHRI